MANSDPIAAWTLQRDALLNCWPETYDLMRPAFNAGDALAAEVERLHVLVNEHVEALGEAQTEVERLRASNEQLEADVSFVTEQVAEALTMRAAARAVLRRYGRHDADCPCMTDDAWFRRPACTCGLAAALGEDK